MMKSELKRILRDELIKVQPQIGKDYLYDNCVDKYVDAMLIEIRKYLALNIKGWNLKEDEFAFSSVSATHAAKRIGKPQKHIYHLMQQHPSTSLLLEVRVGFNLYGFSQLSVMKFNSIYEDLIIEELLNVKVVKNQQLLDDIEKNYTHIVDVDIASLQGCITKCYAPH